MKTVVIELYEFHELSHEIQETILEAHIEHKAKTRREILLYLNDPKEYLFTEDGYYFSQFLFKPVDISQHNQKMGELCV